MRKHVYRIMAVLAVLLLLGAHMSSAYAYFTAYTQAEGGFPIHLGGKGEIEEKFVNWTKKLVIRADADSQPVFVRAKAFSAYDLTYDEAEGWSTESDGFAYYADPIEAGGSTSELNIHIDNVPQTDVKEGETFNVVVIYEMTPALFDAEGNPYADWTRVLQVVQEGE